MSGAAGGTRIPRSAVEQTVKDYADNILSKIEGFKDAKLSGSYNRPEKEDFGDIDIIVTIETDKSKKEIKKMISDLFQSLPDEELPPLQNPKYKGRKYINHGEMVSNLYPISGMPGELVQVDNIISLSQEEGEFKKTVLDYPAELQGLILGLVKTPLLEEDPRQVFNRMGIKDIPEAGENQEYEFHIDTSGLTLRLVTYGDNYKVLNSNIVWQSKDFKDVEKLLKDFNLQGTFEDIVKKVKAFKNERSKNRVKGYFKKSIKVGAAEKGTPKGDSKQKALDTVAQISESFRANIKNALRAQHLEEEEKARIAIFPGAFKPPHKDHVNRILAASEKVGEEGRVTVLISPSVRAKEGQEAINAEQSLRVFNILKEKNIIPPNVSFTISPDKSPVLSAYKEFEANKDQPYIAVFGKDDKARFKNIDEKLPNVVVDSFESAGIGNTSATDLRIALLNKDKEEVSKYIPNGITVDEYMDALGLVEETILEDTDAAADLWEPHSAMLDRMQKQPELLKGLWKSLSKPSRRALVLYFRRKKAQTENLIPKEDEAAAPYGSGYKLVAEKIVKVGNDYVVYPSKGGDRLGTHPTYEKALAQLRAIEANKSMEESLWANINAKKKTGKKSSHKNSNAYKDAKKAGDALKKSKGVKEAQGQKKLRVFDFDDTLVHVDATIYITHKDGSKEGLTPAEYAVYTPQEGDTFNFSEFSSVIKKAKPLEDNIQDLIKSYNDPAEKTTILTARLLGYPVKKYLKDEFGIEPYVVGLGSSDPQEKARWIENQINKGYNDIEFRDDSKKNVDAVADLGDKYPDVKLTSMLVTENVNFVALEKVLDNMFDDLDIDINFTKHFKERVIERGLTEEDIIELMRKIHYYHGEEVSDLVKGENRVFTHLKRLVDVAAINTGYGDDYLKDLVLKTAYKRSDKSEPEFRTNKSAPKLVVKENATYSKDIDIKYKIAELTQHMLDKGMNIKPLPAVEFVNGDSENAKDFFGKTAYYNPATNTIVLYTEGRHPKDIVRSFAHEMIHHIQNLEGRLDDIDTTNTHESDHLNDIEKEANLNGTMTFRNWTDSLEEKKKVKDPFGINAYALELSRGLEEVIVMEGVYDSITAQISSEIFNAWKEQFNKDEKREKASFTKSYDLLDKKGRPVVFDLDADLNFIETEDSIYRPDGDADEGEEEKYDDEGNLEDPGLQGSISLYFQVDPRTLPKLWSTISMDIKDIIRHEVEHLSQAGYNVVPAKELPDDRMLRSYIQDLGLMPASNYYLLDKEIPAMLQGMYYKAKKMKKPFKDVVNSYLDIFVNNETIDNQEKEDILKRWRVAAKELNLPSL
jgi:nicotinic acid mononucleotide adenylyltransferase/predicted nucleotidyltransferase